MLGKALKSGQIYDRLCKASPSGRLFWCWQQTRTKRGMDVQIYNTMTRRKEVFSPIDAGKVGVYHCGPTVYDQAHIGNMRTYVMADLIRRIFEYLGYEVRQVMNITDGPPHFRR